jgi:hypothetical protein
VNSLPGKNSSTKAPDLYFPNTSFRFAYNSYSFFATLFTSIPFEEPSAFGLTITGYYNVFGRIMGSSFKNSWYLAVLIP